MPPNQNNILNDRLFTSGTKRGSTIEILSYNILYYKYGVVALEMCNIFCLFFICFHHNGVNLTIRLIDFSTR